MRYVWVGDTLINAQLILDGFVYNSASPPDVKCQYPEKLQTTALQATHGESAETTSVILALERR